jgi:hypothetical protein
VVARQDRPLSRGWPTASKEQLDHVVEHVTLFHGVACDPLDVRMTLCERLKAVTSLFIAV